MIESPAIRKHPVLANAEDYAYLRQKGLEHIQKLGSRLWTDYNIHDPGVTILELLCYALTDLGYRTGFEIPDLLAPAPRLPAPTPEESGKYWKRQGFHTAAEILTINPLTVRDFRKLLIDLEGVKNAWLHVRESACDGIVLYADCAKSELRYASATTPLPHVIVKGLYDVKIEFGDEDRVGDLNTGKVFCNFTYAGGAAHALIELRLPDWQGLEAQPARYAAFRLPGGRLIDPSPDRKTVHVDCISGNKADDLDVPPLERAKALRRTMFAKLTVLFMREAGNAATEDMAVFEDVPMKVRKSRPDFPDPTWDDLRHALEDPSPQGPVAKYRDMVLRADAVMGKVRQALQERRNLCEDYCAIGAVAVEDIAVCADLDLAPSADIEAVTAEAYFLIGQYMSPDVRFHSLRELMEKGVPVEDIFEGPRLANGFLDSRQVDATDLKPFIYASDIINLLVDIEGVEAVRNLSLAKYDAEGQPSGSAERWKMAVTAGLQPRFYPEESKFLAFKNGLSFLPRPTELKDLLPVFRGRHSQAMVSETEKDIPIVPGTHLRVQDYHPLQYQLPRTYGVSFDGLPPAAGPQRVAQARQLKAYLLFFEQMLVDYLAQLANVSEIFAIDGSVTRTYFSRFLGDVDIRDVQGEIYRNFDEGTLHALAEPAPGFAGRRNRFLDHMLARFGESFSEYALMLYAHEQDRTKAEKELMEGKVEFLKSVPDMGRDRAKAFNYTAPSAACQAGSGNAAGLGLRLKRLLCLKEPNDKVFVVEHLLFRPRRSGDDPLLPIRLPPGCATCGEEDPYSFRLTVVLSGDGGRENSNIEWRRFAEKAIRTEIPAHLAAKICWVSRTQLAGFESLYCDWLSVLAKYPPDPAALAGKLAPLIDVFKDLKSVYVPARLHDCVDGNDRNRVLLNQTVITSYPEE